MHTPEWLSEPAEFLLEKWAKPHDPDPYDVVIVGSGYGGSVAAQRLAECTTEHGRSLSICVLERGREHVPGTFPDSISHLPGHVRISRFDDPVAGGVRDGLFDLRVGKDVSVLVANGLGGGSLINAGVAERPEADVFQEHWPQAIKAESERGELDRYFQDALEKLGANPADSAHLAKHQQFLNSTRKLRPGPATVTVSFEDRPHTPDAVKLTKCVDCGDCATGCNVGAKKTLLTNYLAEAWRRGAEIYTGVTVSHIVRNGDHDWEVVVTLTTPVRPLEKNPRWSIRAKHVILAAGTFGSTEILMRSKELTRLPLSARLGERFSANGDMISAMYKKGELVNASPEEFTALNQRHVGPTITGIARTAGTFAKRFVIEELAIPGALRRMFEEIVTTTAMLDRLGRFDWTRHRALSVNDPRAGAAGAALETDTVAIDPAVIAGCQVFATMGNDGAAGRLQLVPDWNDAAVAHRVHNGAIRVHWPEAGMAPIFQSQHDWFRGIAKDGWLYLPSPLWQPIPQALSEALSGAKPTGVLFSVHPLGGCAMADDAAHGVVNDIGEVFDGIEGKEVHKGLLVLDGSIMPTALGINPLLTITALAERGMANYIVKQNWRDGRFPVRPIKEPPDIQRDLPAKPITAIQFSERMTGQLRLPEPVDAELIVNFDHVADLTAFLRDPLHPLEFEGLLRFPVKTGDQKTPQARVRGRVGLLVRGARSPFIRIVKALWTYIRTRALPDLVARIEDFSPGKTGSFLKGLRAYVALASNVGEIRYMFYEFTLEQGVPNRLQAGTTLKGRKTFEYAAGANPWLQLIDLDLNIYPPGSKHAIGRGSLRADLAYAFQRFSSRLQIVRMRDLPAAWMDFASLGLFFARIILKIHFWSFRLPKYQKYDPMRDVRRLPNALESLHMERHVVGPSEAQDADVFLLLTRYRPDTKQTEGAPVLLIHGLGSGGIQFATGRVNPNLVEHLARCCGMDVWVAELRTSIALPSSVHQWTLDQIARGDVPRLVDFVLKDTGAEQVDVIAHCIGSGMFCTAVLEGRLTCPSGTSKIRRAALLQVGPLLTLSEGTRLRALAIAPLMRLLPEGFVDFSVDDRADWVQSTIDRLLNTYPYPPDEAKHHRLGIVDKPHIANCNRWAGIDGLMFRHENLSEEMLENLGEVLGHSNTTTWAQPIQSGLLERLTNSDGANAYVTNENVRKHFRFPVLFLHGEENDVFLPLTSYRSQELLRRVHGDEFPARVHILPGYRHLDPLIGRNAAEKVFTPIADFLREAIPAFRFREPDQEQETGYYFRRPIIGPQVGWLRHDEKADTWRARVWCRLDDQRSPVSYAVVQVKKAGQDPRVHVIAPREPLGGDAMDAVLVGPLDTLLCTDVVLDRGTGAYEITVFSAHEGAAQQDPDKYHEAERSAGRGRSAVQPPVTARPRELAAALTPDTFEKILAQTCRPIRSGEDDEKNHLATVTVPEDPKSLALTVAVASCRYPGWLVDRQQADLTYGRLDAELQVATVKPSALFLIGDQIYADATAGIFDPQSRRERFYEAYREAWTAPNARAVLSRLPTYMMMDDHEAGDDWHPGDFLSVKDRKLRGEGLEAFCRYQWLHSPGNRPGARGLWYDFELQGFPVFVCDTRSGRTGRDRILDERQFDALTGWLHDNQERDNRDGADRPKFVISPSVIVPFRKPVKQDDMPACPSRSDSWDGFPSQLLQLFSFIAAEKIANVVFLCGDSHLSMTSKIFFENHRGDSLFTDKEEKRPLQAWCIVASPMYGPYPFVNPTVNEFHLQAKLDLPGIGAMRYGVSESWDKSGFTLVTVSRDQTGSWTIQAPHIDAVSEAPKKAEPAAAAAEAAAGAPSG